MSRLPFDPAKMAAKRSDPETESGPTNAPPEAAWSVSTAAAKLTQALRAGLPTTVRIIGEVSSLRDRTHWYFDLKDEGAVLACVMFATSARKAGFTPRDGQSVVVSGRVDFYAKQGKVSIIVESIRPVGEGALDLEFRKLCEELRGLGWFAVERKREIPAFPARIAVITSMTGAALQDVLDTMRRRCPAVEVVLLDARVQGDGAESDVVRALRWASTTAQRHGFDAILLTRGGGSKEDLWTFNSREVARAIVESSIPVVAAIGHETDTTIAELVADVRCATPTQAAMRLSPDRSAMIEQLESLASGMTSRFVASLKRRSRDADTAARLLSAATRQRFDAHAHRLATLQARLRARDPHATLRRHGEQAAHLERRLNAAMQDRLLEAGVDGLADDLQTAMSRRFEDETATIAALGKRLWAVGPMSVLARGYSVTTRTDGRLIRSIDDAAPGDTLRTRLADGELQSVVADHNLASPAASTPKPSSNPATPFPTHPPSHRLKPKKNFPSDAPGLFEPPAP